MRLRSKFENGGSGNTERKADQCSRREQNQPASTPSPAARNLALAHYVERLIERGVIADYTQAARMLGVSQPRMTHLMALTLLAPGIQEAILMGETLARDKELRGLARILEWDAQQSRCPGLDR